jgi:signal transduction histidine kinase
MNIEVGYFAETQSMLRVICILIAKSILMIVVMTFYRIFHGNKSIPNRYMVLISVISAFILLSNLVMMQSGIGIDTEHVGIFSMIFFIASLGIELTLFFFCFKIADSIEKQKNTLLIEINNEMLKKSLDDTKQALDLWRESIHDYKHKIIALTQIAEAEDVDAIKTFLRAESQLVQKKLYYIKTGNSVVDTVINTKQSVAEQNGISVMVHAHISENCKIDAMDLTIIMGNLLDNAIEACRNEMEPYIDIEMKENETFVMIDIRNKYTGSVSETLQTSKREKDFHGIGLKSVKRLVEKYHGTFLYEAVEEQFRVSIVLKKE